MLLRFLLFPFQQQQQKKVKEKFISGNIRMHQGVVQWNNNNSISSDITAQSRIKKNSVRQQKKKTINFYTMRFAWVWVQAIVLFFSFRYIFLLLQLLFVENQFVVCIVYTSMYTIWLNSTQLNSAQLNTILRKLMHTAAIKLCKKGLIAFFLLKTCLF